MDKTDEFQLVQYIIDFKGAQFITLGCIQLLYGSALTLKCTMQEQCAEEYPGHHPYFILAVLCFLLQVVTAWVAYLLIKCSSNRMGHRSHQHRNPLVLGKMDKTVKDKLDKQDEKDTVCELCCGARWYKASSRGGGFLQYLMVWDFVMVAGLVVAFIVLGGVYRDELEHSEDVLTVGTKQAQMVFWLRAWYGFLMFPFLFFKIPGFARYVTKAAPTGYNTSGFLRPRMIGSNYANQRKYRRKTNICFQEIHVLPQFGEEQYPPQVSYDNVPWKGKYDEDVFHETELDDDDHPVLLYKKGQRKHAEAPCLAKCCFCERTVEPKNVKKEKHLAVDKQPKY